MQDLPIDRLGPYPILQFAAALLVMGGLAIAVWRGIQDRKKNGNDPFSSDQRYFFDGPLGAAMVLLKEQKDLLQRIEEHQAKILGQAHEANHTLDDIREDVKDIKDEKFRGARR